MRTIVCVLRQDGCYGIDYVKKLLYGIKEHTTQPFKFVCLSDYIFMEQLSCVEGIEVRQLLTKPRLFPGWWAKLEMFSPKQEDLGDFLYLDLDTVIVDNIDNLLSISELSCLRDMYAKKNNKNKKHWNTAVGSGIMFLPVHVRKEIWEHWVLKPLQCIKEAGRKGDQEFLKPWISKGKRIQDLLPEQIISYKADNVGIKGIPNKASIVVFHGIPRPHEVPVLQKR